MSILDLQAEDLGLIFSVDEFAVAATYTPSVGAASSILVIIQTGQDLGDNNQWRAALQATAVAWVRVSDVVHIITLPPVGENPPVVVTTIEDPEINDTITVGAVVWTVAKKLAKCGAVWTLELSRDLRPTFKQR